MFKLISLSSPTGLFKSIIFKDGLNIILGRYSKSGKDINGIGKTTIINLIDYCLLADGVKKEFFSEKYTFIKHHFVKLDFKIGDVFYSIERGFDDKKKVWFSVNNEIAKEFIDSDLRLILGTEMGKGQTGVYEPSWFRTLMSFYVQNDHNFLQRNSSNALNFSTGKRQFELLTYIFLLLGIDNSRVWDFDNDNVELKKLRDDRLRLKKQVFDQTEQSIDDFRRESEALARKVDRLENGLDNFQFDENSSDIEEKLQELNQQISKLSKNHILIQSKFRDIKESLKIDVDVTPSDISKFYSSIHLEFSEFIKKSLDQVIDFRNEISSNRRRFLKEREAYYQDRLNDIKNKLVSLEQERSKIFRMLDQKSTFDALKAAYTNLVEQKARLSVQLTYVEQLDFIEEQILAKRSSLSEIVASLVSEKRNAFATLNTINEVFLELVDESVDVDSSDVDPYFEFEFKANQKSPVSLKIEVPRGSSLGKGRFKILAFDLTIFIVSVMRKKNFPSFLIHDGVFHAIAHKTRIKFLNYINRKLDSLHGAQYIITVNEDEITFPESEGVTVELDFDLKEKCLIVLEDNSQHMLMGREFG